MTAKIKLNAASGGGSVSLQAPSSSSNDRIITLPDIADGTLLTSQSSGLGKIVQFVSTTKTDTASFDVASGAIEHYTDSSLKVTITPTSASNFLYIMGHVVVGRELLNWMHIGISKDGAVFSQANGDSAGNRRLCTVSGTNPNTDMSVGLPFHAKVTAENTSERYYSLHFSHGSSSTRTIYINRGSTNTDSVYYPRGISTISVMEVAQ